MDKLGVDFYKSVEFIEDWFGVIVLCFQILIGVESEFVGFVDFIKMKVVIWKDEIFGVEFEYVDIFDDFQVCVEEFWEKMIEIVVE